MTSDLRLAELVAALSLATDLGMGQPLEHELRSAVIAVRLGERAGATDALLAETYYVALLRWIGCTSHAHELSHWFDDELEAHSRSIAFDWGRPRAVLADLLRHAGAGRSPLGRAGTVAGALAGGRGGVGQLFRASCEVGERLASRLSLPDAVAAALGQVFERWDGGGWPASLRGEQIARSARIVQLAQDAAVFERVGGADAIRAAARERSGGAYDPELAELAEQHAPELVAGLGEGSLWELALETEPGGRPRIADDALDRALEAVADFADLKSPYTAGHSPGVAQLAARAAAHAGLDDAETTRLRHASLLHDLGRTGVPNGIWDKAGPLSDAEWERVRLHAYFTERTLARPEALAQLGSLAALHHERLDGSGYHRGARGRDLAPAARILAAADVFHALTEPRPHRAARAGEAAVAELRREAGAGRLDGDAVEAVVAAAGGRPRRRAERPAGLTARELEVLRLLARGRTNRQIARELTISPRTAEHHVQHVYGKIGVSTRAAAALYAMEQGLLELPKDG